jgi:hypothetical protein
MGHFALEQWVDFARQAAPLEPRAAMQQHLDQGCESCSQVLRLWQHVSEAASRERLYELPESAVRVAKSQYAVSNLAAAQQETSSMARLLFDSLRQPLLQGVRGPAASPRHLLFGSGYFQVDMRLESSLGCRQVALMGQVLNSAQPEMILKDIPVQVLKGRKKVMEATTNQFGEFHLEFDLADQLRLALLITDQQRIIVPLTADLFQRVRPDSGNQPG